MVMMMMTPQGAANKYSPEGFLEGLTSLDDDGDDDDDATGGHK